MLQNTDDRMMWWRTGFLVLFLCNFVLSRFIGFDARETEFWGIMTFPLVWLVLILLWAWSGSVWMWVVTDRRILGQARPSAPWRIIPLDAVEAAWVDGDTLCVRGGGESLKLPVSDRFRAGGRLRDLLGDRFGDSGQPVTRLEAILLPGERVRLRGSPDVSIMSVLAPAVLATGSLGSIVIFFSEHKDDLAFTVAVGLTLFQVSLLPDMVASWRRRGWWVAVTDKRLLLRRWHEPGRYDAVALESIERAEHDRKRSRFILHCGDRTLFLTCPKWNARRIQKAVGREPGEIS